MAHRSDRVTGMLRRERAGADLPKPVLAGGAAPANPRTPLTDSNGSSDIANPYRPVPAAAARSQGIDGGCLRRHNARQSGRDRKPK